MDTITDYILWLGDRDFDERPFCDTDALVLCQLSYCKLPPALRDGARMTLRETYRLLTAEGRAEAMVVGGDMGFSRFLEAAARSNRFGELVLRDYVDVFSHDEAVQFSAVTFDRGADFSFLAFRGTDDTIAGWKEDFMISFTKTEAQRLALEYAEQNLKAGRKNYIGGHSKGGNLALYAACLLPEEQWPPVERVYILDGPGLCPEVMDTSVIDRVDPKATRIIPGYSVIGKLFEPKITDTRVVRSAAEGLMQHNLGSWCVDHGALDLLPETDPKSAGINRVMRQWIENVGQRERKVFVDEFFGALAAGGQTTVSGVMASGPMGFEKVLFEIVGASGETKKTAAALPVQAAFGNLFHEISGLGFLKWLRESPAIKALLMILLGVGIFVISDNVLDILAMIFFIGLTVTQIGVTIKRLYESHWKLGLVRERVYLCIILIALSVTILFKEQALFLLGSILFSVIFFLLTYQAAVKASDHSGGRFLRVLHILEAVFCFIFGASFLVIPRSVVLGYAVSIGIALVFDGVLRLIYCAVKFFRTKE